MQTRDMGTIITITVLIILGYLLRLASKPKPKQRTKSEDTTVEDYMMVDPDMDGEV